MDNLLQSLKYDNEKTYAQVCYSTAVLGKSLFYVSTMGLTQNRALEIRHMVLAIIRAQKAGN
jgi:hypothetical protein